MKYCNVAGCYAMHYFTSLCLCSRKVVLHAHQQLGDLSHAQQDLCTCYEVRLLFVSCGTRLRILRYSTVCLLYPMSSRISILPLRTKVSVASSGSIHSLQGEGCVVSVEQPSSGLQF